MSIMSWFGSDPDIVAGQVAADIGDPSEHEAGKAPIQGSLEMQGAAT